MDNWLQEERRTQERLDQKLQGLQAIYSGFIVTVDPEHESLSVQSHGGTKEYPVKHPYLANDSWIRTMPSEGASAILQYRSDTRQPEIVNYANPSQQILIGAYEAKQNVFRPLQPGEIDVNSKGLASTFFSRRSIKDERAGILRNWADQDEVEFGFKAPIHRRILHQHNNAKLGDEERFGVVKRPKTGSSNFSTYPKYSGKYAKERFERVLSNNGTPSTLYEKWEGQVFDDVGVQTKQSKTNGLLRLKHNYFANAGSPWTWEIDENGNSAITLPPSATHGHNLTIPQGNLFYQIEKNWQSNVNNNFLLTVAKDSTTNIQKNETMDVTLSAVRRVGTTYSVQVGPDGNSYNQFWDSVNKQWVMSTPTGHSFIFDDAGKTISLFHQLGSSIQLDDSGNVVLQSADGNTFSLQGDTTNITSQGGSLISVGDDAVTLADKSGTSQLTLADGSVQLVSGDTVVVNGKNITLKGGAINLGDLAVFSAVLGEQLMVYLDTHTHPTVVGPTGPPIIPSSIFNANPVSAFISQFVKIRPNI